MTDITKRASSTDEWTYEATLARAKGWMMDNYSEYKLTLSGKEAKKFDERATKAGFIVAAPERRAKA
jgi:hypothetical protein